MARTPDVAQTLADVKEALRGGHWGARELHAAWECRRSLFCVPEVRPSADRRAGPEIDWLHGEPELAAGFIGAAFNCQEFLLVCDAAHELLVNWREIGTPYCPEYFVTLLRYSEALARLGQIQKARNLLSPFLEADLNGGPGPRRFKAKIAATLGSILREPLLQTFCGLHAIRDCDPGPLRLSADHAQVVDEALRFCTLAAELQADDPEPALQAAVFRFVLADPDSGPRRQVLADLRMMLEATRANAGKTRCRPEWVWAKAVIQTLLGDVDEAARTYRDYVGLIEASEAGSREPSWPELAARRREARFLALVTGLGSETFDQLFPPLKLTIFAGHLPDLPGRRERFPSSRVGEVREALRARLAELRVKVAVTSAAAGADLLFTELLAEAGHRFHVVLPWPEAQFCRTSVRPYEPDAQAPVWAPRFEAALEHAASVREIGHPYAPADDVSWQYTLEVTAGIALHLANALHLDLEPLALWDGEPGFGSGGTASFVEFWEREMGVRPEIVPMPRPRAVALRERRPVPPARRLTLRQEVKTMLFADLVGYSKLPEDVIPAYVQDFSRRVSALISNTEHQPIDVNVWGDALYAVFESGLDAGGFAVELTRLIEAGEQEWVQKGLCWQDPDGDSGGQVCRPIRFRIGLHTGPVFVHHNPIVRHLTFTGSHVSRAARIEPIARPGETYASEAFAALVDVERVVRQRCEGEERQTPREFICEYAGTLKLAKGYAGNHRIYRITAVKELDLEDLARAIHNDYCAQEARKPPANRAIYAAVSWNDLDELMREANRAQAAHIPVKLRILGYELTAGHGLSADHLKIEGEALEKLARLEHERWMTDKERRGFVYGADDDRSRKHHRLLVPWESLDTAEKEKDRDAVRNLPRLISLAGFRLRKIEDDFSRMTTTAPKGPG